MNANQLYTTEHKMPRFLRVNDQNFEYVNRKWRKIPLDSLEIYLDSIAQKCENNNLLSFGRLDILFDFGYSDESTRGTVQLRGVCQLCKYQIEISYRAEFSREPFLHYSEHFGVLNF